MVPFVIDVTSGSDFNTQWDHFPTVVLCGIKIILYLSCFSKYQVVMFSSRGEVSSIHITVFNLSDHITPSGLLPVDAMCGGNG